MSNATEPDPDGTLAPTLAKTLATIRPADAEAVDRAWCRQRNLLKPNGSLGALEILGARLAGSTGQVAPSLEPVGVAVFAGDHGVHAQGVSPWPQAVTAQMVAAVVEGSAAVAVLARQVGASVLTVDVGVAEPVPGVDDDRPGAREVPGLVRRRVAAGTADLSMGRAMSPEHALAAVEVGIQVADRLVEDGHRLLVAGDLGIANTTASAALVAAFTGASPTAVTGRGTGVDDDTLARKVSLVERALRLHAPEPGDPMAVLAALGGLEHAAIAGFLLRAAARRVPVVLDGVVACSAALVAQALAPAAVDHWVAGHRSVEPGASVALGRLGLEPLLDLQMRLGEGTGAVMAVPLVQAAARVLGEMGTFPE
ncbi:MAG TPA: nicotinate-nucleotide--dimethylbenzimidazole phosphoribosyltransferase [Actinomycetales bacterium]|nr:nicotinate-nucleotide--dimethylbenzimidazole phosphoribosyltransferase [Actinomycetales bacterium]